MSSLTRGMEVADEKTRLKEIQRMYGKKPTERCPKCHKKSLFFKNKDGIMFCVRCDREIH